MSAPDPIPGLEMALAAAESITSYAEKEFTRRNRVYARICEGPCSEEILEEVRLNAVSAYEAFLDAIRANRLAIVALDKALPKTGKIKPTGITNFGSRRSNGGVSG